MRTKLSFIVLFFITLFLTAFVLYIPFALGCWDINMENWNEGGRLVYAVLLGVLYCFTPMYFIEYKEIINCIDNFWKDIDKIKIRKKKNSLSNKVKEEFGEY